MKFVRYVAGEKQCRPVIQDGLLCVVAGHYRRELLLPNTYPTVRAFFDHLNKVMPCPPFSKNHWGKEAICWFKADGIYRKLHKKIEKELVPIVKRCTILDRGAFENMTVRKIFSERIGGIVYEDDNQVVAIRPKQLWRSKVEII